MAGGTLGDSQVSTQAKPREVRGDPCTSAKASIRIPSLEDRWKVLLEVSQMFKKTFVVAALVACFAGTAAADIICPDSSYATVQYATAKDRVTISPGLNGETFPQNGITVKVYLKNCNGAPLAGVPREEVVLFSNVLHICTGGNVADAATDLNGAATFTGSIRGGGCANSLTFIADGIPITQKVVA